MRFDKLALTWDKPNHIERARVLSEKISEEFSDTSDLTVLDFGCATGLMALKLSDTFKEVYCTDLSEKMLEVLSDKLSKSNIDNIKTVSTKDLTTSKFQEKFDVIYSSMVFHHIENIEVELKKLYSLLKKNGSLIIIDLDKSEKNFHKDDSNFTGHHGFERENIMNVLASCGFKNINIKTVFDGKKPIGDETVDFTLFLLKGEK